mmetsp:Transcript_12908/g.36341  ORF Transcript_12908/g.36341 Transcript_12908/m.36341 type:complete len:568 (-) Transcript_12908:122-1825(-)|eukprot:CAMPEP_0202080956 /NCGR_PEP_ID=MMETSP0964-20121228/11409_1 /ASSEMBLY_ACC=CAM_ASM_000500 /TAXON_ID=4773 /ORGANISM="Schizochytrium aggregatum, Strain ATCC28209" /LENGTH=567 /DNA_ID=CAMNT_0048648447 /DNA_START=200 /DNA_END=1903 /DNA_ORIENTATION=+
MRLARLGRECNAGGRATLLQKAAIGVVNHLGLCQVPNGHCAIVDAKLLHLLIRNALVRGRELERVSVQEIGDNEPCLKVRKVHPDAASRRKGEWRETWGGWVVGCQHLVVPDLALDKLTVGVKLVHVVSPERGVAMTGPIWDLHVCASRKTHLLAAWTHDIIVKLQLAVGAWRDCGPEAQRLHDTARHKRQALEIGIFRIAAVELPEKAIHLALQLCLVVRVARKLKEEPGQRVRSGVVTCERKDEGVALDGGRALVVQRGDAVREGTFERAPGLGRGLAVIAAQMVDRARVGTARKPLAEVLAKLSHKLGLVLPAHGAAEGLVRGLHELLVFPEQGELELRLRLVQEKVVHVDRLGPIVAEAIVAVCAELGACYANGEDPGQRQLGEESGDEMFTLVAPALIVHRGDNRPKEGGRKVGLLLHVNACNARGVLRVANDHLLGADGDMHLALVAVLAAHKKLRRDDVGGEALLATVLFLPLGIKQVRMANKLRAFKFGERLAPAQLLQRTRQMLGDIVLARRGQLLWQLIVAQALPEKVERLPQRGLRITRCVAHLAAVRGRQPPASY